MLSPSAPPVEELTPAAFPPHLLADRSSDLEVDDLFVGAAQFAQDVVGVLGEQWRPGQLRRSPIELHRARHQSTRHALRVRDLADLA